MKVVISSGHGKYIRGASDIIDEVDEARKVVESVAAALRVAGVTVDTFHDNTSHDQNTNLHTIVNFHNSKTRDWDISVHFNAYQHTSKPMGSEVLYVSQTGYEKANEVVDAICQVSGLINRGPKERTDLYFLNNTEEPAILIETCFCDSQADVDIYHQDYDLICNAIAGAIAGEEAEPGPIPPEPPSEVLFSTKGKCSYFGGPDDTGVSPSEGLAFIYDIDDKPELFLPYQPSGTTGLARRLNPWVHYVACRWDYNVTSRDLLKQKRARVRALHNNTYMDVFPADWGPNQNTGRVADLSPSLMEDLGLTTDDEVEVIFPCPE